MCCFTDYLLIIQVDKLKRKQGNGVLMSCVDISPIPRESPTLLGLLGGNATCINQKKTLRHKKSEFDQQLDLTHGCIIGTGYHNPRWRHFRPVELLTWFSFWFPAGHEGDAGGKTF